MNIGLRRRELLLTVTPPDSPPVSISRLRMSMVIDRLGAKSMGELTGTIYGLKALSSPELSKFAWYNPGNTYPEITLEADGSLAFTGQIFISNVNFTGAGETNVVFKAYSAIKHSSIPSAPISFRGSIRASEIFSDIADLMGMSFVNNGVDAEVTNVYLVGDLLTQARSLASMIACDLKVELGVLSVSKRGFAGSSFEIPINPSTGMVGSPTIVGSPGVVAQSISFRTLFNPSVDFGVRLRVSSSVPHADGSWITSGVRHELDSETPGGRWFSYVQAIRLE